MEHLATPSCSKGNNGRSSATPKNRKKNPGDALGSGKSQLPITRFYSPVSSSSDKSSQPYTPISSRPQVKRRTAVGSRQPEKRLCTEAATFSQSPTTIVLSSGDSSDDIFSQDKRTISKPIAPEVPKSSLNLIKRRLYPVTSSPISSDSRSSRPKKKLLSKSVPKVKVKRSRILSDSDSEDEVHMENSHRDQKPLQDLVPHSSQVTEVRRRLCPQTTDLYPETSLPKPLQDLPKPQVAQTRRLHCPETSSQVVVISSSEESDFELHNSKQSHSFLSQSICGKSATQSCQKSVLSLQTNRIGCAESIGSSLLGNPPNGHTSLKKRCSVESSSDSASSGSKSNIHVKTPATLRDVNISSNRRQKGLQESAYPLILNSSRGDDSESAITVIESECGDDSNDDKSQPSLILGKNGDISSIYLQDTIPLSHSTSYQSDTEETNLSDGYKKQLNSAIKPGQPRQTVQKGSKNSPSHQEAEPQSLPPLIPNSNRVEDYLHANKVIMSECGICDSKDDGKTQSPVILDKNGDGSSLYFQDTIPPSFSPDSSVQSNTDETDQPDSCQTQLNLAVKPGHPGETVNQDSTGSPSHLEAVPQSTPLRGHSIYHEETIDPGVNLEATLDLDSTVDFNNQPVTSGEPNTSASANRFERNVPTCLLKGTVIEASDEEDESVITEDQSDHMQVTKSNRTSLGAVSELMDVSHISGSDDSDFSGIVYSDDDVSINGESVELIPESAGDLASHMASLLVEDSDESSHGITSIMNSMLDASADFFSDVVSSLDDVIGGSTKELEDGRLEEKGSHRELSPTEGIVSIALELAGLEKADDSNGLYHKGSAPWLSSHGTELDVDCHKSDGGAEIVGLPQSDPCKVEPRPPSSGLNGPNSVMVASTPDEQHCSDAPMSTASSADQNVENAASPLPQSCSTWLGDQANSASDSCMNATANDYAPSMTAQEPVQIPSTTNEVPSAEIKVVCGIQPPESSATLHIAQNLEKTLIHNPNRPLLLDTIISECQNYAEQVLNQEPIKTFMLQYSSLPQTSKWALHGCLLELLEDSNRWLKYQESSAGSIDTLVSSRIFEYLDKNEHLVTKLNYLTLSELTDVLCKLGNSPSKSIETMKNSILNKFSSAYTCERVKKEVTYLINRKFVKLTTSASFCIKICLELFALPLNLCDKLYKTVDIARFANRLIRDLNFNRFLLLPLKTSKMVVDSDRVFSDLSDLCRLKSEVFESYLNDESIYRRVNDICSSIAVMEFSSEMDPSVKNNPTFRFLMTNYVHALDEQLKFLLCCNTSDIEFSTCVYLGVLLKQNVTGSQHKVKWCRERMRHLSKILNSYNVFEEFSKILKEPVSPVEFTVRSEFVSNSLKIKKLGLSLEEKLRLTKLLRPISHKKAQIAFYPLNSTLNHYSVLTRKPKGKNINLVRANIFEQYAAKFPCGVEDNGGLLLNAVYLTFWRAIYLKLDGAFVNKFQSCPLEWGSEEFFSKRQKCIDHLALEMKKRGLPAVFKLIKTISEQFSSHRCVVDWQLVVPNMSKMLGILEALGSERFLKIGTYVLGKLDERVLGFPDIVLWNPDLKTVKFLGLKKPSDLLYPHQILWLEKLSDFDVDAEELLMCGSTGLEQCSQLE